MTGRAISSLTSVSARRTHQFDLLAQGDNLIDCQYLNMRRELDQLVHERALRTVKACSVDDPQAVEAIRATPPQASRGVLVLSVTILDW